jgi:flavin reductase (DIM6/NTAB) family NADH-FMN oxidoreductase RutF
MANVTTANVASEIDELALAGLTTEPSELVKPPRVKESPIHLECEFYQEIELPCTLSNSINTMIIGTVIGVHISERVLVDGLVDLSRIKPLARLGYMQYTAVDELFAMNRPAD